MKQGNKTGLKLLIGFLVMSSVTACTTSLSNSSNSIKNESNDNISVINISNIVSPIMIRSAETINAPLLQNQEDNKEETNTLK